MMFLGGTDALAADPLFRRTRLFRALARQPLGFVDVGAAGGVHPVILPVASLTACTLFEPDEASYRDLRLRHERDSPFKRVTIHQTAVGARNASARLRLTKSRVNSSLLEPRKELGERYRIGGFRVERRLPIRTSTLDTALFRGVGAPARPAEFLKLDCQGAEYLILKGAARALASCVALWCEVEFFQMYRGQKIFAELDLFLRKKGFDLYGLYPNYVSAKTLDRRVADTEERIVWADALYFRDPLERSRPAPARRDLDTLIVAALLTGYFDFALELAGRCCAAADREPIEALVHALAGRRRQQVEQDAAAFAAAAASAPVDRFLLAKRFVDAHKGNNSVDIIPRDGSPCAPSPTFETL